MNAKWLLKTRDALSANPAVVALFCALAGAASFAGALALQHGLGHEPCPLCIFQRVAVLASSALALCAAAGLKFGPKKVAYALAGLAIVAALAGEGIAIRHMVVMWTPQEQSCGPDLAYLMENFAPSRWLPKVFAGEAECAASAKDLVLGLPIPVWSAILFALQGLGLGWALRSFSKVS
jgi:disulfide bond formation protein DsbB